jgi:hypothetical protein
MRATPSNVSAGRFFRRAPLADPSPNEPPRPTDGLVDRLVARRLRVPDKERSVSRICKTTIHGGPKWHWSINTSPYPALPPHNGIAPTLDDAKLAFKAMKRRGVKPFDEL